MQAEQVSADPQQETTSIVIHSGISFLSSQFSHMSTVTSYASFFPPTPKLPGHKCHVFDILLRIAKNHFQMIIGREWNRWQN
jgi:hypothetical protein